MTAIDKQQWLGPLSNIQDNSNLIKTVTFRSTDKSIISKWSDLIIDPFLWTSLHRSKRREDMNKELLNFSDHWDTAAMNTYKLNTK